MLIKGQPPNLWRPQQFYTGKVGAPPQGAPATTASEWNRAGPTSGHIEALFAEKTANSHPEPTTTRQEHALPAEVKIELAVNTEALPSAVPNTTMHTIISVPSKSDNDESMQTRVVTLEVPVTDLVI